MTATASVRDGERMPLPRPRRGRAAPRTRLDDFPRDPLLRWSLRLALAVPYLLVAWFGAGGRTAEVATPNQQLLDRLATIEWTRADPEWIGQIFPPLSTLLAAIIPGGRAGLAVAGALVAGILLQKLLEVMVQRRFPPSTIVLLTLALAANPLFAYNATENFPTFLGLAFFALAASDLGRFVSWRNTRAGFRAGILLMLATLSDLSGPLYVLTAALAAPFLRLARSDQKGARGANVLVVVYPTAAALGAMFFLNWVFTGHPFNAIGEAIMGGIPERWTRLGEVIFSTNGALLIAAVVSAWLVAIIVRRPGAIFISTLVFLAILGAFVVGLIPSGSAGNTFILMTSLAIALIPAARTRLQTFLSDLVAVAQIAIAWATALTRPIVQEWTSGVGAGLGLN
jgi:hypothetical protein